MIDLLFNFDLLVNTFGVHKLYLFKGLREIKQESFKGGSWWL